MVRANAVEAFNGFAFDLFEQLDEGKNILVSPVSVAVALSMVMNGAAGETREAMAQGLLAQGIEPKEWNDANKRLLEELAASDVTLEIANSFWLRQGLSFLPSFIAANEEYFVAEIRELDFSSPHAVPLINSWVKERTQGLIPTILTDAISEATLSILVNAVYFYGSWTRPFPVFETSILPFHTPRRERLIPFMRQTATLGYLQTEDLQLIRLPYGKGDLAMYVFLPKDIGVFCKELSEEQWTRWRKSLTMLRGRLTMPKFEFGYEQMLSPALRALGMGLAFLPDEADFTAMSTSEQVFLQEVKHKTFIAVDEKGTEAAAVTFTSAAMGSAMPLPPAFDMLVDRPFFCIIHDQKTDTILFMGAVYDPTE